MSSIGSSRAQMRVPKALVHSLEMVIIDLNYRRGGATILESVSIYEGRA